MMPENFADAAQVKGQSDLDDVTLKPGGRTESPGAAGPRLGKPANFAPRTHHPFFKTSTWELDHS